LVFRGGFGTWASLLALPDVGLLTLTEMADAVHRIARRVAIPVVANGNNRHGDLHNVMRTARDFERAAAALSVAPAWPDLRFNIVVCPIESLYVAEGWHPAPYPGHAEPRVGGATKRGNA
jgi:hypothetical protein